MYLEPEVIEELEQGRMISAIKVLRTQRTIGIKEAKMLIEEYLAQNPYLKVQKTKMSFEPIFLLVIIFIVYALYRILFLSQ
jgi:hypothetical protein